MKIEFKFIVPTIENGEELCIQLFLIFPFCFPPETRCNKKSSVWIEWYIIFKLFQSQLEPPSKFPRQFPSLEKNRLKFSIFRLILNGKSERTGFFMLNLSRLQ